MPDAWLTAADPEPPRGTKVETAAGRCWSRDYGDEGDWIGEGDWWRDPASWATVTAGGPVRVVWRPAYALTDEQVAEVMRVSFGEESDDA